MTTLYKTMLGFGILVIVGLLFAVLLLAVRKGQKPSRSGESRSSLHQPCARNAAAH